MIWKYIIIIIIIIIINSNLGWYKKNEGDTPGTKFLSKLIIYTLRYHFWPISHYVYIFVSMNKVLEDVNTIVSIQIIK